MNERQQQTQRAQLMTEQSAVDGLREIYRQALEDIDAQIAVLNARQDQENLASIAFQRQYQENLRRQVSGILDQLNGEQFDTVSDFLTASYENGYVGVMYDMAGQGVPVIAPVDQAQVAKAVTTDSKLSRPLYDTLGEDTDALKIAIQQEVTRGVIQGKSYSEIAKLVEKRMVGDYRKFNGGAYAKAVRIARTEGHRVQNTAAFDAQKKAQSKGADIVKQWDATLDARTRDSHAKVDGELRGLDEKFSNGLRFPGDPHGEAAEVVNCRCALLQRAKWALDQDELDRLQQRAEYYGLDKAESFEDFKRKYLSAVQNVSSQATQNTPSWVYTTYGKTHGQSMDSMVQSTDPETSRVWNKYQSQFKTSDPNYTGQKAYYSPLSDSVTVNVSNAAAGSSYQAPYQVVFHEYGHMTDYLISRDFGGSRLSAFSEMFGGVDSSGNPILDYSGLLGKTAKQELKNALQTIKKSHGVTTKVEAARILIDDIKTNYSLVARSDVSDMLEGAGIGVSYPLGVGHGKNYHTGNSTAIEFFAEVIDGKAANPKSIAQMRRVFPNAVKVVEKMISEVL